MYVNGTSYFTDFIRIPNNKFLIQDQRSDSNYTSIIEWRKGGGAGQSGFTYNPQVGQHNTGGTDESGSICVLPYATSTNPWEGSVGLYICRGQAKLDGHRLLTSHYATIDNGIKLTSANSWISIAGISSFSCPDGTAITQPDGANPMVLYAGAASDRDCGIFYLSNDSAYIANSSDNAYAFGVFDTDITQNFSVVDNASLCVRSNGAGTFVRSRLGVNGTNDNYNLYVNGTAYFNDIVSLASSKYGGPSGEHGMNCNNSDIVGINGLFTADNAETFSEGLNFYRSASTWDAMAASNGTFYFGSNVGFGAGLTGSANIVAGAATFNGRVFANRSASTVASFVWNKSGTNWGGIGYNGQTNENYFGPCDSNGVWTNTDTDCWTFRNRIKIVGATSNNMAYNTGNPRLIFAENANTQQVGIVYTDYDSYRTSKGLRIMDVNNEDTDNVWLEVQGNVYAPTFIGNLNGNAAAAHRLIDQGTITAIDGTSRYTSGLRIGRIYNSGYPFSYGVTLTMEASNFGAELIFNGLGGGGATGSGDMRFRTHSDWGTSEWGGWRTVLDTANYAGILDGRYINASGDTMTGHLNATAGLTWNHAYWNPNGNIYCQPTDNYQEWSIDVGSTSYTGSFFHVWSARNSVSMLRCFSDNNSVDIPSGAFTVSGGNAYFTKTIICSSQIGNYGEGIRLNCDDGQWATITMGSTGDTGTRDNCWSIHRKSDNNFCISRNSSDGVNGLVMTATGMGLGTTSPGYRLHVNGTSYLNGDLTIPNNHAYYGILGSNSSTTSSNTGGLTWFNLDGTAGAQVNVNDTPTSAWWYILRNRHTNTGNNYYTDIAIPFNDTSIYYKTIRNGSVVNNSWVKVLDSNNYSSYVFLPWALFKIGQAQSSGSSIYIWWGNNNDFSPEEENAPSGGSNNFSLNSGNRSFINCPRSGYVRITVNLAVKASIEVSNCYLDINEYYNGSEHWKGRRICLGNIKTNYTTVNGSTIVYVRKGACLQFKLGSTTSTTLYEDYQNPYWPHIILEYIT